MSAKTLFTWSTSVLIPPMVILLAAMPAFPKPQNQPAPTKLKITIVEGEGAINNIRQRTAREPIVQVTDENNRPVAGASVYFLLPDSGPTATFPDGTNSLRVMTDKQGRAVCRGLKANAESGKYQIRVEAGYQNLTASATINQANAVLTSAAAAGAGGVSGKLIAILAIAGAAVAGGVIAATSGGKGNGAAGGGPPRPPATTVTPGSPSVGAP